MTNKIVVFDLDETLGYFMELGMFWDALNEYIIKQQINLPINQPLFNKVLDLFPEFLRPNILDILNYIKQKKLTNHCNKLMIYTNNQGSTEWVNYITTYFDEQINYHIFDQIISAFKIRGKRVELCRTTHMKTHSDLIKCTKIPKNTQICFLDDLFHPNMTNENVYYINLKPYTHDLDFNEMITRLLNSDILDIEDPTYCRKFMLDFMKQYHHIFVTKTKETQMIDQIISKKILQHLYTFFKIKPISNKTKRHIFKKKLNKTLKK